MAPHHLFNEQMNAAFSKLSYWDPIMSIELGDMCATKRLLQVRHMSARSVDMERKIRKEAAGLYGEEHSTPQVVDFFKQSLALFESFQTLNKKLPDDEQWVCILWSWEVVENASKTADDIGALVFVDPTLRRFIVTKHADSCCVHHTAQSAGERANVFFCLALYLGFDPEWVRFCWFGGNSNTLEAPPTILDDDAKAGEEGGFGQVDDVSDQWGFVPMLKKKELEKIDNVIASSPWCTASLKKLHDEQGGRDALYKRVFNANNRSLVQHTHAPFDQRCTWCDQTAAEKGVRVLLKCGQCKITQYCSRACQRSHWKSSHKTLCKAAQPAKASA